jgi:hypothetical protein
MTGCPVEIRMEYLRNTYQETYPYVNTLSNATTTTGTDGDDSGVQVRGEER